MPCDRFKLDRDLQGRQSTEYRLLRPNLINLEKKERKKKVSAERPPATPASTLSHLSLYYVQFNCICDSSNDLSYFTRQLRPLRQTDPLSNKHKKSRIFGFFKHQWGPYMKHHHVCSKSPSSNCSDSRRLYDCFQKQHRHVLCLQYNGCVLCLQYNGRVLCLQYNGRVLCLQYNGCVLCLQHNGCVLCLQYSGGVLCLQHNGCVLCLQYNGGVLCLLFVIQWARALFAVQWAPALFAVCNNNKKCGCFVCSTIGACFVCNTMGGCFACNTCRSDRDRSCLRPKCRCV